MPPMLVKFLNIALTCMSRHLVHTRGLGVLISKFLCVLSSLWFTASLDKITTETEAAVVSQKENSNLDTRYRRVSQALTRSFYFWGEGPLSSLASF